MLSSCSVHTLSVTVPAHTWAPIFAHKLFRTRDCLLLVLNKSQPQRAYQQQQAWAKPAPESAYRVSTTVLRQSLVSPKLGFHFLTITGEASTSAHQNER